MGCNCKRTMNTMVKYSEDEQDENVKTNWIKRIPNILFQAFFGLIVGSLVIVLIIPILIYVLICLILGKEPSLRIKNFNKN